MVDRDRVVAVSGPGGRGSGYVIGPRVVLTSAHVVTQVGTEVTVFRPGDAATSAGSVVWSGTAGGRDDAALILVEQSWQSPRSRAVRWGRLVTDRPGRRCEAWGVPERAQQGDGFVDLAQVSGRVNPGDRRISNRYVMAIEGHRPDVGGSPWGGLSGAAVFSGDLLLGVVMADEADSGHTRLVLVPAYVLHHDEKFRLALAHHGVAPEGLTPVEFAELSEPALSVPKLLPSPGWLLHPSLEVVPFRVSRL